MGSAGTGWAGLVAPLPLYDGSEAPDDAAFVPRGDGGAERRTGKSAPPDGAGEAGKKPAPPGEDYCTVTVRFMPGWMTQ